MHLSTFFFALTITLSSFGCTRNRNDSLAIDLVIAKSKISDLEYQLDKERMDHQVTVRDLESRVRVLQFVSDYRQQAMICLSRKLDPRTPRNDCYKQKDD